MPCQEEPVNRILVMPSPMDASATVLTARKMTDEKDNPT
jgi:hypothetical protein